MHEYKVNFLCHTVCGVDFIHYIRFMIFYLLTVKRPCVLGRLLSTYIETRE